MEYFVDSMYWWDVYDPLSIIHIGVRYQNNFHTVCKLKIPITVRSLELLGRIPEQAFRDKGIPRTNDLWYDRCEICDSFIERLIQYYPHWRDELDLNKARDSI